MLEKSLEAKCREYIKSEGGALIKLQGVGLLGWPDRIALAPKGRIMFVEFKKKGDVPKLHQSKRLAKLSRMGFHARWFDDYFDFCRAFAAIPNNRL